MERDLNQMKANQYANGLLSELEQLGITNGMRDLNVAIGDDRLRGEKVEVVRLTKALKHREKMLSTVNRVAEMLLTTKDDTDIEAMLMESLEFVGRSVDVDCVQIWRNEMINGELFFSCVHEWMSDVGKQKTPAFFGSQFSYAAKPEWKNIFEHGGYISGSLSEMSREDRAFFSAYNVESVVLLPLFLQERFWGFFSIGDCRSEYTFTEDEISILRSVSLMMANTVNHSAQTAKIREAHERTRLLLDAMPLSCHLWNRDSKIFDCNEENTRLFNLKDRREILDSFYLYSPEYQPDGCLSSEKVALLLQKAFDEGKAVSEWMHQLLDGTPIPAEITLVRVAYEDDYVVAGYARDLREHKRMVREIEENAAKLEIAMKEAQAANNAKSDFLAGMSHEMRTPLNAVIGLAGLTLEIEGLNDEAKNNLEKVFNAGSTLLNIVNDILDISKIESGKLELIPNEYDIPSLINDTVTQNLLRIGEKPITFNLDIHSDMPTRLFGDDLRIKQILSNILSNAMKYTKEGSVELGIRSERIEDDAVLVTAWVKDTGIGIRPEDIDKLFSDYSQVNVKANRAIEGSGLGLAITKKMLELMDGSITVESEYGKGSVFTVKLKQKFVTDAMIGESVVKNLKSFRYSDDKRKQNSRLVRIKMPYARVLVVDDNITNLDVAKGLMKPYAMQIDCVTGGQQAIDAVRMEKVIYSAIFMDHMMPVMDGIEATQRIREIDTEYAKSIPIIALTANAISGNEEMFLSSGFQAFLSKPINLMQLDSVIRRWVRDKSKEINMPSDSVCQDPNTQNKTALFDLPVIPNVDSQKGLDLYAGDMETYLSVLESYAKNTPAVIEKLRGVTAENLPDYAINVHGLKGSSAGIGAEDIRQRGLELEMRAKAGDLSGVLKLNDVFLHDAETLTTAIKVWLTEFNNKTNRPRLETPDPDVLAQLRQSLIDYNVNGVDAAMDILESSDYETNADLIPWLKERIIESDFDDAANRIAVICGTTS